MKAILLPLGIGAACLLAVATLQKKSAVTALQFLLGKVSVRLDGFTPVVTIVMTVQNPSSQGFTLRSFAGTLTANGNTVGSVSTFQTMLIKPLSQTALSLDIRLQLIGIATDLYNAIVNGTGFSQALKLTGNAQVDGLLIPITQEFKI